MFLPRTHFQIGFTTGIPLGTRDRPVPIPVGDEQGGRAKVRATQATAQHARWCALYRRFCSSQGGDGMAGASSSSGRVASHCLMCENEAGASSSSGQQGRIVGRVASCCLRCEDEAWALSLSSGRGRRREGDGEGALSCRCRCRVVTLSGRIATSSSRGGRGGGGEGERGGRVVVVVGTRKRVRARCPSFS